MMLAEQYFSWLMAIARSTAAGEMPLPVTVKCIPMVVKTFGSLSARSALSDPKVFTTIGMHFTVTGKGISPAAVERAIAMSHEKYCSASIMLGKTAEITTSFEVVSV